MVLKSRTLQWDADLPLHGCLSFPLDIAIPPLLRMEENVDGIFKQAERRRIASSQKRLQAGSIMAVSLGSGANLSVS